MDTIWRSLRRARAAQENASEFARAFLHEASDSLYISPFFSSPDVRYPSTKIRVYDDTLCIEAP